MTPEQLGELMRTLGVASPLVGLLVYLLRQATEERREITNRFLGALETTVAAATRATQENTVATRELAAMTEANRKSSVEEHTRIVMALERIATR